MKFKFLFAILIFGGLLMTSCSNKYEKAIVDYNQTIGDTKLDLGFKAIDVKEVQTVTVGDSLEIYKHYQDTLMGLVSEHMDILRKSHDKYKDELAHPEDFLFESDKLYAEKEVERSLADMEELKKDSTRYVADYNQILERLGSKDEKEALFVVVECKFSIEKPMEMETTAKFKMSSDGKVCYGRYEE